MTRRRGAPATEVQLLLVDGNNLLHRLHGAVTPAAQRELLARLRQVLPSARKVLVFDGHRSAHEGPLEGADFGVELRYAGGSADDALLGLIDATPWQRRGWTVLVTDDRPLADRARTAGALTRRLDWLVAMLERPDGGRRAPGTTTIGRPPR